jgi:hypothetical protein
MLSEQRGDKSRKFVAGLVPLLAELAGALYDKHAFIHLPDYHVSARRCVLFELGLEVAQCRIAGLNKETCRDEDTGKSHHPGAETST